MASLFTAETERSSVRIGRTFMDGFELARKLHAIRGSTLKMVLLDVQMPEMDGIEATQHICRKLAPQSRPRIIAVTAGVMENERQACLDAGMDEFLNKPIVAKDLAAMLARWVRLKSDDRSSRDSI